ncbi:carboxypeptidase-like regulatory domain-containing protein [Pedobacter sp. MC2016-14]|uniref:carboxypeptidase-like regulatory domain-containing protein n=1 Tax=Pedobacter sp. MC2016-14 TaxID=2897327 RepID=UPI001E47E201|nr:carboxypeptidase-like regulatory domain-containing protein [Pedobacter sp. MC2016-14]MCD0488522.1 carboxypeptidase-like regulatory domain-containing protein [Pedobacter sp. MC2016-14]
MKHFLSALSILIIALLLCNPAFGQKKLTTGRTSSYHTYIYKLTDQEAFKLASKTNAVIADSYMHTLVDSFYTDRVKSYSRVLPLGTYIYVNAVKDRLAYALHPVNNVNVRFINDNKNFQLIVTDLKGNELPDAMVAVGKGKKLKYNSKTRLYAGGYSDKNKAIVVRYQGHQNYFSFQQEKNIPYVGNNRSNYGYSRKKASFFKRIFAPKPKSPKVKKANYSGYMVFNKPMYKPLDTVKLKAYLLTGKGKALKDKEFRVEIVEYNEDGKVIGFVKPYRDGGYTLDFVLADSLDLDLDANYQVIFKEKSKDEWKEVIRGSFRYEEYELKSINFSVRTEKTEYHPGDPLVAYMKAVDENMLAVPDGRVDVVLTTSNVTNYYDQQGFVSDTLWKKTITLDPTGETKLVVPDSIFPKADIAFMMFFNFLNSNNESKRDSKYLYYKMQAKEVKAVLKADSIYLDYFVLGKSAPQKARLHAVYPSGLEAAESNLQLPAAIPLNAKAIRYDITIADGFKTAVLQAALPADVLVHADQGKDSLQVSIDNPHKIPFWYTVFSGNKAIFKGYTSSLDTVWRHTGTKAAQVLVNYVWAGAERTASAYAVYAANALTVKLTAPEIVYPGQTVNMQIKVTDASNKPAAATDVSAFAYTSKFTNQPEVNLPDFSKKFSVRKLSGNFKSNTLTSTGEMKLKWERWARELGLDTLEYYRFTQTKDLFAIQEDRVQDKPGAIKHEMRNGTMMYKYDRDSTMVVPFVVKEGVILPVHIVYIDGVPVYFSQAEQLKRYAFKIERGKHNIELRTTDYLVRLDNYFFDDNVKTILSIAADVLNTKARVSKVSPVLSREESELLSKYMIKIEDNFKSAKTIVEADTVPHLLNPPPTVSRQQPLVVGPFAENYLKFNSETLSMNFIKEPGYVYTFLPGLLKQKSHVSAYGFNRDLAQIYNAGAIDYKQSPLKKGEIDSIWNDYLDLRSYSTVLSHNLYSYSSNWGKLAMKLDTNISKKMPFVKNVIIFKETEPDFLKIHPGNTVQFYSLAPGKYRFMYLFKDNRYFISKAMDIKDRGTNYFDWKDVQIKPADSLSIGIDHQIKSIKIDRGVPDPYDASVRINEKLNDLNVNLSKFSKKVTGRVIDATDKTALPGVSVKIKGISYGVSTDLNGRFTIKVPEKGKLVFSYIGYLPKEIEINEGNEGDVYLVQNKNQLDEVVVIGYGSVKKTSMTGAVSEVSTMLAGRVAGIQAKAKKEANYSFMVRGSGTLSPEQKPLYIVDGLIFSGDLNSLSPDMIVSIDILKDAAATSIYGARGANGVIIIKSKSGNLAANPAGELVPQEDTMRTNFSDYAFWQPKLFTDANGVAAFTVKFPDDITNWSTKLIAMNGKKQSGTAVTGIKSFKMLSANFVSPQFAIVGDSIKVIGKLMNYSNAEETVLRKFSYNDLELRNNKISYKNAHIDTIAIVAKGNEAAVKDSLKFEYTMKQDNGYFDGEIRKIPVFEAGVLETKGVFNALTRDTTINYAFDASLGKVTLRAEASVFPTLLDEMEKLRKYEYLCNEQMASKLKALLLEKKVRLYLSEEFKEEKNIKELIKKLQNTKKTEGTWGWWQNSQEELWISLHVTEALLMAEQQGYAVKLDKTRTYNYLVDKLAGRKDYDQVFAVRLLHLLSDKYYLKDWVIAIEKQKIADAAKYKYELSVYDRLQIMELRQKAGLPVDFNWLLQVKKQTMFGNSYWGNANWTFWDNSVQNTLMAYRILKKAGNYKNELEKIHRYFLEQRKDGQWRNTYESSLILETILPDMMVPGKKAEPAAIVLNKTETINKFPFDRVVGPQALSLQKKGDAPVYFTAYQQFNNPKPLKVDGDFKVTSRFVVKDKVVSSLKAGVLSSLEVRVNVRADADYVMIEIPIPAGCSYENKQQNYWGPETHREYFKNKVAVFCTKLKQGTYYFNVELMPRYSGNYILNPAKAEMMYYPVFYGREGMKRVAVN